MSTVIPLVIKSGETEQLQSSDGLALGTPVSGILTNCTGLPIVGGGTGAITTLEARTNLDLLSTKDYYQSLGSIIVSQTLDLPLDRAVVGTTSSTGILLYQAINAPPVGTIVQGAAWYQAIIGNYTNPVSNKNRLGLCTYSTGTLTLVASCADDPTLWKTIASNTVGTKAFTSPYTILANTIYYIVWLYNNNGFVTNPSWGTGALRAAPNVTTALFTNSAKITGQITGQTDLPSTQAMSGVNTNSALWWWGLY